MIPKITQEGPRIMPRYWCATCGRALPNPADTSWRFCPDCGEEIEYAKAKPVQWREQNCEQCGSLLIRKMPGPPPYFISTDSFAGGPLCYRCMEEHCTQTNCLQCEIGKWPNCRYDYIKQQALRKAG